jgi:hypothetical protein
MYVVSRQLLGHNLSPTGPLNGSAKFVTSHICRQHVLAVSITEQEPLSPASWQHIPGWLESGAAT